jgi:hypothetical protein
MSAAYVCVLLRALRRGLPVFSGAPQRMLAMGIGTTIGRAA